MKRRLTAKLQEVKAELRRRMHQTVPEQGSGCSQWFGVTSRTTSFRVTGRRWGPFRPSAHGCGIAPSAAEARRLGSPGSV
jgi:hypothetical protein